MLQTKAVGKSADVQSVDAASTSQEWETPASLGQHMNVSELNLVDILGALAAKDPQAVSLAQQQFAGVQSTTATAVCSSGHLRTFAMPGMYKSLQQNLLSRPNTDLFLVGHFGAFHGSPSAKSIQKFVLSRDDEALQKAIKFLGLDEAHMALGSGDCDELEAVWKEDGVTGRSCRGANGYRMQLLGVDHCIRLVKHTKKHYDLFVRMRPDIGIFAPMPWDSVDLHKVTYMPKDCGGKADFFFAAPMNLLDKWWDHVLDLYKYNSHTPPDYAIFSNSASTPIKEAGFPAAIVRGEHLLECFRLVNGMVWQSSGQLQEQCKQAQECGLFGDSSAKCHLSLMTEAHQQREP